MYQLSTYKNVDDLFTLSELKKNNPYNVFKNVFIKPVETYPKGFWAAILLRI